MTLQENRDRLAEFVKLDHYSDGGGRIFYRNEDGIEKIWLPDQDLNQCRMIEEKLNDIQRLHYVVVLRKGGSETYFEFLNLSAEQKFQALIQTLFTEGK